jgi:hypothetical protein
MRKEFPTLLFFVFAGYNKNEKTIPAFKEALIVRRVL